MSFPFAAGQVPTTVAAQGGMTVADLDRDGHPDLLLPVASVVNLGTWNLVIAYGAGDGTFPVVDVLPVSADRGPAVSDLDGDGWPEVIATTGPWVSILRGNQGHDFKVAQTVDASAESVTTADVNGDHVPDILTVEVGATNGSQLGLFAGPTYERSAAQPCQALGKSAWGDIDADGLPDAILIDSTYQPPFAIWFSRSSASGFSPASSVPTDIYLGYLATGDFDGDRRSDIVYLDEQETNAEVRLARANYEPSSFTLTHRTTRTVVTGDLNRDGLSDVVVTAAGLYTGDQQNDYVDIYLSDGQSGLVEAEQLFGFGGGLIAAAVADVNGDGKNDIVTVSEVTGTITTLLNRTP
jgi:hypothetical protein